MKDNKFDIEELVIRYCEGNVSESEKCDVENWMSESEENSEIVRKMYTLILATDTSIVCDKIDVDAAWMRMKEFSHNQQAWVRFQNIAHRQLVLVCSRHSELQF